MIETIVMSIMRALPVAIGVFAAYKLAMQDHSGWGWFLLVAFLMSQYTITRGKN